MKNKPGQKDAGNLIDPSAKPNPTQVQDQVKAEEQAPVQEELLTAEATKSLIGDTIRAALEEQQKAAAARTAPAPAPVPPEPSKGEKVLSRAEIVTLIRDGFAKMSKETPPVGARDSADARRESRIERPVSWCKGNLPLHGKQLLNALTAQPLNYGIEETDIRDGILKGEALLDRRFNGGTIGGKGMTSTGTGTGDELVPSDLSAEIQRRLYIASNLSALFAAREINMPTDPYTVPLITTRPQFLLKAQNVAGTASTPGTAAAILAAKTLIAQVDVSDELDEDSIVPMLPMLEQSLADSAADAIETAILNGDTTGTHMDTDTETGSASLPECIWMGLRKLAITASLKLDVSTGGVSVANILALLKLLGKWGVNTGDCALVFGVKSINSVRGLAELMTMQNAGNQATLFNGKVVPAPFGTPIITSSRCREDVNNTGVNGASGNTYAVFHAFNVPSFLIGRRREFKIESDRDKKTQTVTVVASMRKAFVPLETPSASITTTAIAYNYTA